MEFLSKGSPCIPLRFPYPVQIGTHDGGVYQKPYADGYVHGWDFATERGESL